MLKNWTKICFAATSLFAVSAATTQAQDLVIYQKWSSPGEVAALNVLKKAAAAKGINWIDITIPHNTGSNVNLMNLVTGGNPPNIFSENNPAVYRDLTKMGLDRPLTAVFRESGALEKFPPSVVNSITVDGQIMKIPLGIHIDGMLYYNLEAAKKAGVDPAKWLSLDEMYADFDKIKAAGMVPLALGAQQWQIGYLTHALLASVGDADLFMKIYGPKPEETALDAPELKTSFAWLRKFQKAADAGAVNRDWNMTTNMVITGQALMQIHGDWMKGEWRAAGKEPGKDFGCIPVPGAKTLSVTVDGWGVLGNQPPEKDAAEVAFAKLAVDPVVNAAFAAAKGSTPIRTDVAPETLDACSRKILALLKDPAHQVQNPHSMVDADWQSSIWEVAFNFWSNPDMTVDTAIAKLKDNYQTILK